MTTDKQGLGFGGGYPPPTYSSAPPPYYAPQNMPPGTQMPQGFAPGPYAAPGQMPGGYYPPPPPYPEAPHPGYPPGYPPPPQQGPPVPPSGPQLYPDVSHLPQPQAGTVPRSSVPLHGDPYFHTSPQFASSVPHPQDSGQHYGFTPSPYTSPATPYDAPLPYAETPSNHQQQPFASAPQHYPPNPALHPAPGAGYPAQPGYPDQPNYQPTSYLAHESHKASPLGFSGGGGVTAPSAPPPGVPQRPAPPIPPPPHAGIASPFPPQPHTTQPPTLAQLKEGEAPSGCVVSWRGGEELQMFFMQQEGHIVSPKKQPLVMSVYKKIKESSGGVGLGEGCVGLVEVHGCWRLRLCGHNTFVLRAPGDTYIFKDTSTSPNRTVVVVLPSEVSRTMRTDLTTLLGDMANLREEEEGAVDKISTGVTTVYSGLTKKLNTAVKGTVPGAHKSTKWLRKNTGSLVRFGGNLVYKGIHFVADQIPAGEQQQEESPTHTELLESLRQYRKLTEEGAVTYV